MEVQSYLVFFLKTTYIHHSFFASEAFVGQGFFKKRVSYHAKGKCGIKVRLECRLTVVVRETNPEERQR